MNNLNVAKIQLNGDSYEVIKGSNLRVRVSLSLEEIANGVEKKIKVKRKVKAPGSTFSTCTTCNGTGQVTRIANTILGRMQTSAPCSACGGSGKILTNKERELFEIVKIKIDVLKSELIMGLN